MTDIDLWATEQSLWVGGAEAYDAVLDFGCLMAFPSPAGIMVGPVIAESLRHAPRWEGVIMEQRHLERPAEDVAVLAYAAFARREGAEPYRAYCTSTYVRGRLVQHQQTPR